MSLEINIDIDIDSTKGFNKNNTLITITCFILDFDNNTSIALKVFDESKRYFDSSFNKILNKIDTSIILEVFNKIDNIDNIIFSSYFYIKFIVFYKYLILY